jgi:hypothetical protein
VTCVEWEIEDRRRHSVAVFVFTVLVFVLRVKYYSEKDSDLFDFAQRVIVSRNVTFLSFQTHDKFSFDYCYSRIVETYEIPTLFT